MNIQSLLFHHKSLPSADLAPSRKASHLNNFNLIRLLAATQVLLVHTFNHFEVHTWYIDAIKIFPGVPIFFFISGYLIFLAYERNTNGLLNFFRNRVLRIYPALWVCVVLSTIAVALTGYFVASQPSIFKLFVWIVGQLTIVQFYNPDFMRNFGVGVLNGALWTITIELQFYVITPILAFIFKRYMFAFGAIYIVSLLSNYVLNYQLNQDSLVTKLFSVTFGPWVFMFMTGMLVARFARLTDFIKSVRLPVLFAIFVVSMNVIGTYSYNAQNAINPLSFLLLAPIILNLAHMPLGGWKLFDWVRRNDISYGVYLYHMPVISLILYVLNTSAVISIPATLIITIVLGWLSWVLIEKPALSLKWR